MENQIEVFPPHGFVRLTDWMGTELDIVNAARVSFHRESEWQVDKDSEKIFSLTEPDAGLIRFLLENKHGTPFEQGFQSMWHIRLPIFVMREWVRHRIGHLSTKSRGVMSRCVQTFTVRTLCARKRVSPDRTPSNRRRPVSLKRHSRSSGPIARTLGHPMKRCWMLALPERSPLNLYTEIRWTANARSLMHFLALRSHPDAMYEIRKYAKALEKLFTYHMPIVYSAFVDAGRVAP